MNRRTLLKGLAASGPALGLSVPLSTAADRFHVPAEEAPHEATFMQWPASRRVYRDSVFLRMTRDAIAGIANAVAVFEPVIMLAAASEHADARKLLSDQVTLWDVPTEDLWCRDSGPITAVDGAGRRVVRHIRFNGWGGRQIHARDGAIAARVAERLSLPLTQSPLQGEAGGVEQDGHGLLMAHESSWVNDNRNPGMSQDQVERALLDAYGADRMIWSKGVYGGDITDYHIDSLARFTGPGRVLMNLPEEPDEFDPFHMAADDTRKELIASGLDVEIIPEPVRTRVKSPDFVASYANYYVCNGAVVAAEFGDRETDAIAAEALQRHFPGREIIPLNVDPLGELGGGVHCATRELPAA